MIAPSTPPATAENQARSPALGSCVLLPGTLAPTAWLRSPELQERLRGLRWLTQASTAAVVEPLPGAETATQPLPRRLPHEQWLHRAFNTSASQSNTWSALPVMLGIGIDQLHLNEIDVALTSEQADQLERAVKPLLEADQVALERVRCGPSEVWRLRFLQALAVECSSPLAALGQATHRHAPVGADSARWRKFVHELEMAWHCSGPDQRFAAAGTLPVNSLWLAEPLALPGPYARHFEQIVLVDSGCTLTETWLTHCAQAMDVEIVHLSDPGAADRLALSVSRLWLDASALRARLADDPHAWVIALEALDRTLERYTAATNPAHALEWVLSGKTALRCRRARSGADIRDAQGASLWQSIRAALRGQPKPVRSTRPGKPFDSVELLSEPES